MQIEQKQNRIFKPQSNTTLSAEETNQVTTELENVIRAGNLTPNAGTLTQVRDAIQNVVDTAANELQEQIDAITSASDVFDVVGTYAQLQAYDTSTVPVNDIIKVLQDETRNNAMTYYRWNGTSWVFIGAEGPYYTVSETDTKFATKAQLPGIATTQQVGLVKPDGQTTIVQQDGTLSVSSNVAASLPLFTPIWADHILNNASYLRADTFSWQSGNVYISAYQHLVDDVNGITSETETVAGTTITFYRATDGHKIVLADQESNVATIFNATGIAWYYILDTTNQRFKLPRSKWNFVGLRDTVGNYVPESLPNITGETGPFRSLYSSSGHTSSGALSVSSAIYANMAASGGANDDFNRNVVLNASNSSSTYQNNAPVQQRATQAYLYFYVGNTVQNETSVDVAELAEDLNSKADLDLSNLNNTGKIAIAHLSRPSATFQSLTVGASGTSYTALADGEMWFKGVTSSVSAYFSVYEGSLTVKSYQWGLPANGWDIANRWPVRKGATYTIVYGSITIQNLYFVYAEGSKSEAN